MQPGNSAVNPRKRKRDLSWMKPGVQETSTDGKGNDDESVTEDLNDEPAWYPSRYPIESWRDCWKVIPSGLLVHQRHSIEAIMKTWWSRSCWLPRDIDLDNPDLVALDVDCKTKQCLLWLGFLFSCRDDPTFSIAILQRNEVANFTILQLRAYLTLYVCGWDVGWLRAPVFKVLYRELSSKGNNGLAARYQKEMFAISKTFVCIAEPPKKRTSLHDVDGIATFLHVQIGQRYVLAPAHGWARFIGFLSQSTEPRHPLFPMYQEFCRQFSNIPFSVPLVQLIWFCYLPLL